MRPRFTSGCPNNADSAAIRKSQAMASSQPPPNAIEFTAAMVTVGDCSIPRMNRCADSTSSAPSASGDFENSLMSAPALKVKMFEEASTSARTLPSTDSHRSIRSRTACGESGFAGGLFSQAIATSPRVSSSTVSRGSPGSGCGYGKKPWPLFLPSRPCATSRRSTVGGSNESPHSDCARSSCSRMVSRPASSARVNGPGRIPAPIIIPISMSLAEATPSSSTRHDSTRVFRPIRSTIVPSAEALAVLIEPLPGLLAEVLRTHELLHRLVGRVLALDHLDQPHHRSGIEEVEAADLVGPLGRLAHLGDGKRRRVRRQDRVPGSDLVQLAEDRLLDLHPLRHGLDHEVHVAEAVVIGGPGDPAEDLLTL